MLRDGVLDDCLDPAAAAQYINEASLHAARRSLVDWFGCAIAGMRNDAATAVRAGLACKDDDLSMLSAGGIVSPRDIAFIHATAGHALDFDDENEALYGHPGATVIPATLAVADSLSLPASKVLESIVIGYEAAARLGQVANPGHYLAGWHATSTLGAVAATVACTHLVELSESARTAAVSLACVQAGGLRSVFGSHLKPLQVGAAASAAVTSVLLARQSMQAPARVLDGYLDMVGSEGRLVRVDPGRPAILDTAFKTHAACGATHCMIEAVASTVRDYSVDADDIASIDVHVGNLTRATAAVDTPTTPMEAQFSLRHLAALAATTAPILPQALDDTSPVVGRLRQAVVVHDAPEYDGNEHHPARVELRLRSGAVHECTVAYAKGSGHRPLADAELSEKFTKLTEPFLGSDATEEALRTLWAWNGRDTATALMALSQPGQRTRSGC